MIKLIKTVKYQSPTLSDFVFFCFFFKLIKLVIIIIQFFKNILYPRNHEHNSLIEGQNQQKNADLLTKIARYMSTNLISTTRL